MSDGPKNKSLIILTFLFLVTFFGLQPFFELLPNNGSGRDFIAAALSAIIVTLITSHLLDKQHDLEQDGKKKDELFKARLKLYGCFMSSFYKILEDKKIEEKDIAKLKGISSNLFSYGGQEAALAVEKFVQDLEKDMRDLEGDDLGGEDIKKLEKQLNEICKKAFRNDLIGEQLPDELPNEKEGKQSKINLTEKKNDEQAVAISTHGIEKTKDRSRYNFGKETNLTKSEFVRRVFIEIHSELSGRDDPFGDFRNLFLDDTRLGKLEQEERKHFEEWRSMPIWLLESKALALKSNSRENNWRRYDLEQILRFGETDIVIRVGQNTDSVNGLLKLLDNDFKKKWNIGLS